MGKPPISKLYNTNFYTIVVLGSKAGCQQNLDSGKSNLGPTMFKFNSSAQVKLESEFRKDLYPKVVGLKNLHLSHFWALAKFCPKTAVFQWSNRAKCWFKLNLATKLCIT